MPVEALGRRRAASSSGHAHRLARSCRVRGQVAVAGAVAASPVASPTGACDPSVDGHRRRPGGGRPSRSAGRPSAPLDPAHDGVDRRRGLGLDAALGVLGVGDGAEAEQDEGHRAGPRSGWTTSSDGLRPARRVGVGVEAVARARRTACRAARGTRKKNMPDMTAACTLRAPADDHQRHPHQAEEEGEAALVVGLARRSVAISPPPKPAMPAATVKATTRDRGAADADRRRGDLARLQGLEEPTGRALAEADDDEADHGRAHEHGEQRK